MFNIVRNICVEVTRFCTKQGIYAGERPHREACEAMQPTPIRDACIMPVPASPSLVPSVPKPSSYQKRLRLDMMAFVAWSVGLQKSIFPLPMCWCVWESPASLLWIARSSCGIRGTARPPPPSLAPDLAGRRDVVFECDVSRTFVVRDNKTHGIPGDDDFACMINLGWTCPFQRNWR